MSKYNKSRVHLVIKYDHEDCKVLKAYRSRLAALVEMDHARRHHDGVNEGVTYHVIEVPYNETLSIYCL